MLNNNNIEYRNDDEKIEDIRRTIDGVKLTMSDNIDRILDRGEQLDVLIDKSDNLNASSFNFQRRARNLRLKLCKENAIRGCLIFLVILFIIYVIIGLSCRFDFSCARKHH